MAPEDAAVLSSEPNVTSGRDIVPITPSADPLRDGADQDENIQVARWLLLCELGAYTFTTIAGTSRTFTVVSGMTLPVKLEVFATHVTAAAGDIYAIF